MFEWHKTRLLLVAGALALPLASCGTAKPPALAIGSPAPEFALPGTDGRTHSSRDYAGSRVLAVVFTSNTCPAAQRDEARIKALHDEYRGKGVSIVAINPNRAADLRLADLSYSDVGDSMDDMKARVAQRRLDYPYLSDGSTQAVTRAFKVVSAPHLFLFDQDRKLRYEGAIGDDPGGTGAKSDDARSAIEALLAGRAVPVAHTPVGGCPVIGLAGARGADPQLAAFEAAPVTVEMAGAEELKRLRQNGTGKFLLINFWATWCAPCASEFPDLEATYRIFKPRGLEFVTVSVNDPGERPAVLEFLQAHHASHRNLQFATADVYALQGAFDPKLPAPVPLTLLLAPNGDVVYQELGELDTPKLRRAILANLPDDGKHPDQRAYWATRD